MKKDILKSFGERVRSLRETKGWSQEKFAEISEFHRTYIGMVERGERNISLRNIERLARALEIDIPTLMQFK